MTREEYFKFISTLTCLDHGDTCNYLIEPFHFLPNYKFYQGEELVKYLSSVDIVTTDTSHRIRVK